MANAFKVYKSSAGSGKTFQLVYEYLKLLLSHKKTNYFKHILAITFTNKATAEMKERIVKALYEIGTGNPEGTSQITLKKLLEDPEIGLSEEEIKARCEEILSHILHSYADFNVTTIDKFSHRIIRSFAQELHLPQNFDIEMDDTALLKRAISLLLEQAGEDNELTSFLVEYALERAQLDKNWRIKDDLEKLSGQLISEESIPFIHSLKGLSLQDFVEIRKSLNQKVSAFEKRVKEIVKIPVNAMEQAPVSVSDFAHGDRGVGAFFQRFMKPHSDWPKYVANKNVRGAFEKDKWTSSKAGPESKQIIENDLAPVMSKAYADLTEYFEKELGNYIVHKGLRDKIGELSLLIKIQLLLETIKKENNIVLLSDFNKKINEVLATESVPFIYERVGEKYHHYLIDEFQDTSVLQWQNILPLVEESLAYSDGRLNLLVGDAKQSIYRFRGGEAAQFSGLPEIYKPQPHNKHIQRVLEENYFQVVLDANYRSARKVVEFNNAFFGFLTEKHQALRERGFDTYLQQPFRKDEGYVHMEIFEDSDEYTDEVLQSIVNTIRQKTRQGYEWGDVAILVNTNKKGSLVTKYLIEQESPIPVLSSDSLLLSSNPMIQLVIWIFRLIVNPSQYQFGIKVIDSLVEINSLEERHYEFHQDYLQHKDLQITLSKLGYNIDIFDTVGVSLYEFTELLLDELETEDKSSPFMLAFMDVLVGYQLQFGSDMGGFIRHWDERLAGKASVEAPEGTNAVQVMTVHKSKGLEFPVVIYPFVDDKGKKNKHEAWIHVKDEKLKEGIIALNKRIENTPFASLLKEEEEATFTDEANKLYVALTRAKDQLYVMFREVSRKKNSSTEEGTIRPISEDIQKFIKQERGDDGNVYELGTDQRYSASSDKLEVCGFTWRTGKQLKEDLLVTTEDSYYDVVSGGISPREYGNLLHECLAGVADVNQYQKEIDRLTTRHLLSEEVEQKLSQDIQNILAVPEVNQFYREHQKSRGELSLITETGEVYRPDRVMITTDKVRILEFKSGNEEAGHIKQVENYKLLATQITGKPSDAWIVYSDGLTVVSV